MKTPKNIGNLQVALDAAQDIIAAMVEKFKKREEFEGRGTTNYDVEMYELGLVIDFIRAFGRYIKESDVVCVNKVSTDKGVIVMQLTVKRADVAHHVSTYVIFAGGYNIQCLHYRYIVKTSLPSLSAPHGAIKKMIEARKKLTKRQRMQEDLKKESSNYEQDIRRYTAKMNMTDTEVLIDRYLLSKDGGVRKYDELNEYAKADYPNAEAFDQEQAAMRVRELAAHRERFNEKGLNRMRTQYARAIAKKQAKIDEL